MKNSLIVRISLGVIMVGFVISSSFLARRHSSPPTASIVSALHPTYVVKKGQSLNTQGGQTMSSSLSRGHAIQNLPNVNVNKPVFITEMPYLQNK